MSRSLYGLFPGGWALGKTLVVEDYTYFIAASLRVEDRPNGLQARARRGATEQTFGSKTSARPQSQAERTFLFSGTEVNASLGLPSSV